MQTTAKVSFEGESIKEFLKGFRSEATKESYTKKLRYFLEHVGVGPDEFLSRTKESPRWAEHIIIDYVEARRNQVSGSTISQVRDALKHFYEMNDFENGINWAKITKMMPRARKVGSDRAPTVEEVRKMVDNSDLRMKCIILLLISSGVRVGAIDYFTWRDVEPVIEAGSSSIRVSGVCADDTTLYFDINDLDEAMFVVAILNAPTIDSLIKPMQSRGQWGERHIQKKVLELPLPRFNPKNKKHIELVRLAKEANTKAQKLIPDLESKYSSIGKVRQLIKVEVSEEVLKIDRIVRDLLSESGSLPNSLEDFA